jgi:ABC-type uncharacterized transport system permease subunit
VSLLETAETSPAKATGVMAVKLRVKRLLAKILKRFIIVSLHNICRVLGREETNYGE